MATPDLTIQYLNDVMQTVFGNLPRLISLLAKTRNISNDEAITYLQSEIRRILRDVESNNDDGGDRKASTATRQDAKLIDELRAEADFLRKIYRDRNSNIVELRETVVRLRAEINFLRKSLSKARAVEATARTDNVERVQELERELQARNQELQEIRQQSRTSRRNLLRECEQNRRKLNILRANMHNIDRRLNERERDLVNLAKIIYPQISSPDEAIARLRYLVTEYQDQIQTIADLKRAYNEQSARTLEKVDQATSTLDVQFMNPELRECLNSLATEADLRHTCEQQIANLQAQLGDYEKRELALTRINEQLKTQNTANANARVQMLNEQLSENQRITEQLQREIEEWREKYEQANVSLSNAIKQLKRSDELSRELEQRIAELAECEKLKQYIRDLLQEAIELYQKKRGANNIEPDIWNMLLRAFTGVGGNIGDLPELTSRKRKQRARGDDGDEPVRKLVVLNPTTPPPTTEKQRKDGSSSSNSSNNDAVILKRRLRARQRLRKEQQLQRQMMRRAFEEDDKLSNLIINIDTNLREKINRVEAAERTQIPPMLSPLSPLDSPSHQTSTLPQSPQQISPPPPPPPPQQHQQLSTPSEQPLPSSSSSSSPPLDILAQACKNANICQTPDYDVSGEISSDDHAVIPQDDTEDDENDELYANERDNDYTIPLL
nr:hypothetical protein [Apis mellifera nudivirus]